MNVQQLIEQLKQLPQDATVLIYEDYLNTNWNMERAQHYDSVSSVDGEDVSKNNVVVLYTRVFVDDTDQ